MNGLYGYPNGPSTMAHMGQAQPDLELTLTRVVNGQARSELLALQRKQMRLNADIAAQKIKVEMMNHGPQKTEAERLWALADNVNKVAHVNLREAIKKYNELSRQIRTFSLGTVTPKLMSGMNAIFSVSTLLAITAVAGLVAAFAGLVFSIRANLSEGRGYIDQVAGLTKEVGGVINQTTWAVVAMAGLYVGLTVFSDWRKKKKSSGSKQLAMSDLKMAEGVVLA